MSDVLELALKNLQGKLSVAKDKAQFHKERYEEFNRAALSYAAAYDALQEVMGGPVFFVEEPDEEPVQEEAPAEAPHPFHNRSAYAQSLLVAKQPDGYSLNVPAVRRELHRWYIRYPLARSHRAYSHFIKQCLIAACRSHYDYELYVANGGFDLSRNTLRMIKHVRHAVEVLQVDVAEIEKQATELHDAIYMWGVEGKDYA